MMWSLLVKYGFVVFPGFHMSPLVPELHHYDGQLFHLCLQHWGSQPACHGQSLSLLDFDYKCTYNECCVVSVGEHAYDTVYKPGILVVMPKKSLIAVKRLMLT